MPRPVLTPTLAVAEFTRCYWLKEELLAFCRQNHLPMAGSKQELSERIAHFLTGEVQPAKPAQKRVRAGAMPQAFTASTLIGPGWRCSQALRAFFERELGRQFHFDATLRDLIHHGQGKTLAEAMQLWQAAQERPPAEREIGPQFEYNQHVRDYFKAHPGASLKDAIQAWKIKKQSAR